MAAEAMQHRTTVEIRPDDAGETTPGHQVTLAGNTEITTTVMSADRSRTRAYRVTFEPTVTELACGLDSNLLANAARNSPETSTLRGKR